MFADARSIPNGTRIQADICIIGAGAAGITLALGFAGTRVRVCVLESGGLKFERRTQELYKGAISGLEYEPLDLCRVRGFGGSTGPKGWGGWCKPLSDVDFARRHWVPLSGWPINRQTLDPYYVRARASLGFLEGEMEWAVGDGLLNLIDGRLENEICPLSPSPDLGAASFDRLKAAENIQVLLHANALEIVTNSTAERAVGIRSATLEQQGHFVEADYIVAAAGGLENARVLLLSNQVQRTGLGNQSGFVGRCFMEHPRFAWGRLDVPNGSGRLWRYDPGTVVARRSSQHSLMRRPILGAGLTLEANAQAEEEILGARSWIVPASSSSESEGGKELKELVFWLKKKRVPSDLRRRLSQIIGDPAGASRTALNHLLRRWSTSERYQFITVLEQAPNPDSRVVLDQQRDQLGLNRIRLEWRLGDLERRTLARNQAGIVEAFRTSGMPCLTPDELGEQSNHPKWVWHHIGTTRMSSDPAHGVVDADCRVHALDNLYLAGSSVFPTGGNDMPTLTVVALAHRLADHLKSRIARSRDLMPHRATKSPPAPAGRKATMPALAT